MNAPEPLETATPEAAFSLNLTGLDDGTPLEALAPVLSRMLRRPAEELPGLLRHPPLCLGLSRQRDVLERHQAPLHQRGCRTSIEPVLRYRDWTLPEALTVHLQELADAARQGVFGLVYVRPAPGIAWMQQAARSLPAGRGFPLNHGQMLVDLGATGGAGAGRQLLDIQTHFTRLLDDGLGKTRRLILSALAISPDEAEDTSALLDMLAARLAHGQQAEEPADDIMSPQRLLQRPLAGRAWSKLVPQGLTDEEQGTLGEDELTAIRLHWPLDQLLAAHPVSGRPGLARIREQYEAGALRRLERCWDLVHESDNWEHLPELPTQVLEILDLTQQENSEYSELSRLVSGDPALSGRVLQIVNSSYYGLRQRVDSLDHALVILGMEEIAQLAMMLRSEDVFAGPTPGFGNRLWRHSATTAEIARALAVQMQWTRPTGLYAAALLHDVGKILLYNHFNDEMQELERIAKANHLPLHEVEREHFGHDHATLGALLLQRWGLPEHLCRRVRDHHGPLPGETRMSEAAALIGLADHLAHRMARSESWADRMRLRRIHASTLKPQLGELDLKRVEELLKPGSRGLRTPPGQPSRNPAK